MNKSSIIKNKNGTIIEFHTYEEFDCFCPFCSDDTLKVSHDFHFGKHVFNEHFKLFYKCCNLIIEVKFDKEFADKYKENFYMSLLSRDRNGNVYDLVEEYNKKAIELRDKVVSLQKIFMEKGYEQFMDWRVKK